jgi:MHS family proline/betaine transporter-like MFS transporter
MTSAGVQGGDVDRGGPRAASAGERRRAVTAAAIGNVVEWYDFATYGLFAVAIAANFFSHQSRAAGLLSTFAVFAVSFFVRPIGAVFFGHLGDRYGRRGMLLTTVALMGGCTVAIGLIPSYASIGLAAPVLLVVFRVIQGFSAGGEWSGSSVYTVEYATAGRHNLYGSWVQVSASAGTLLGSLTAALCGVLTSSAQLEHWAWRIPFVLGGLIGLCGLLLRLRLEDTPEFRQANRTANRNRPVPRSPLWLVLSEQRRNCLAAVGVTVGYTVSIYMFSTYLPTYVTTTTNVQLTSALLGNSLQLAVLMVLIPFAARLADRIGSWKVLAAFAALLLVFTLPLFELISVGQVWSVIVAQLAFAVIVSLVGGCAVATTARLFPTNVRSTGLGISYNVAVALFGGTAPYISTWLIGSTGSRISPAYYVLLAAAITGITALTLLRTLQAGRPATQQIGHHAHRATAAAPVRFPPGYTAEDDPSAG